MSYAYTRNPSQGRTVHPGSRRHHQKVDNEDRKDSKYSRYPSGPTSGTYSSHGGGRGKSLGETSGFRDGRSEISKPKDERSLQSKGSHYVLPPDPERGAQLKKCVQEGDRKYAEYKDQKREMFKEQCQSQPSQRLGGAQLSAEERAQLQMDKEKQMKFDARVKKIHFREKREEYQRSLKEAEDREIQEKKIKAREQAKRIQERDEQKKHEQDVKMREARLKRFGDSN